MTQGQSQVKVLPINKFAEICRTTPRTLRFYEKKGLLKPAYKDEFTKYRSYYPEQARQFLRIKLLQNFHIPLKEIGEVLAQKQADHVLSDRLKQLEAEIVERQQEYAFLNKMNAFMFKKEDLGTLLKKQSLGPYSLFGMRIDNADYDKAGQYRKQLYEEAKRLGIVVTNTDILFYLNTEFQPKNTTVELSVVCKDEASAYAQLTLPENYSFKQFPKTEALTFSYSGPDDYFILVYQKIFQYLKQHKIKLKGNVFDIYERGIETKSRYAPNALLVFPIEAKKK